MVLFDSDKKIATFLFTGSPSKLILLKHLYEASYTSISPGSQRRNPSPGKKTFLRDTAIVPAVFFVFSCCTLQEILKKRF